MEGQERTEVPPKGEKYVENAMNLTLMDPSRFGWSAGGGLADLLPPQERARRKGTRKAYLNSQQKNLKRARSAEPQKVATATSCTGTDAVAAVAAVTASVNTPVQTGGPMGAPPALPKAPPIPNGMVGTVVGANGGEGAVSGQVAPILSTLKDPPNGGGKLSPQPKDPPNTTIPAELPNEDGPIRFKAVGGDNDTLDMFAYHRGREGFEMRDKITGDLLCDTTPTDTNHGLDEPKSNIATVMVQFPLDDQSSDETRYYKESIQWDFGDPETPPPMVFAAGIAEDFGLDYAAQWDLAESIQHQLRAFCHEFYAYSTPALLQAEKAAPAPLVPCLYGEITGFLQQGGVCEPKRAPAQLQREASFAAGRKEMVKTASAKLPAKRRASNSEVTKVASKVEDVFYQQVRMRLRAASVRDVGARAASISGSRKAGGEIKIVENCECHVCLKVHTCGVFPCGIPGHAYCSSHLGELGLPVATPQKLPLFLDYCPVCSLACNCTECVSKLDATCVDFKSKCVEQGVTPDFTVFDNVLEYCRRLQSGDKSKTKAKICKKRKSGIMDRRPTVPKIPLTEFPREVVNSVDMDFEYDTEYKTMFTEKGAFLVTSPAQNGDTTNAAGIQPNEENVPQEDGSVDFCNVCRKVGNLLCCDFCPRAFHSECVPPEKIQQDAAGEAAQWECPSCSREKLGLPGDRIDGDASFSTICSAFGLTKPDADKRALQNLKLLSILHSMLRALMDFDFGYMFKTPVNCKEIPTYATIVKKPMDLGTIVTKILKGGYKDQVGEAADLLESVSLAVLKDVELVWHNCFIFNVEGSAVYRMAEVQRRRAQSIQRHSFDQLLSVPVKKELADYVVSLHKDREDFRRLDQTNALRKSFSTGSRHKIAGTYRGPKGRPIAALDPDTGMLAKIYTTMMSALNALEFLQNLKHKCEWDMSELDSQNKLRKIVSLCQEDPTVRLYGYRWVYLDDLRFRKVIFPQLSSAPLTIQEEVAPDDDQVLGLIQMKNGEMTCFFNSIEESLSYPGLSENIPNLRERLRSIVPGSDFTDVSGILWRRFHPEAGKRDFIAVQPAIPRLSEAAASNEKEKSSLGDVCFVKEDLIAGNRSLAGFPDVETVFQDWKETLDASLYAYEGPKTLEIFLSFFLDGDRNIDGIRWKSVTRPKPNVKVVEDSGPPECTAVVPPPEMAQQGDAGPGSQQETLSTTSHSTENMEVAAQLETDGKSVLNGRSANCQIVGSIVPTNQDEADGGAGRGGSSLLAPATNKETAAVS